MNKKAAETAEHRRQQWSRLMSEAQVAFLRDVQGFIDFGIRNGLTFPMVMSGLVHDLNEVARDGFLYEKTLARGFVPMVAGHSKITSDDFGESDEDPCDN